MNNIVDCDSNPCYIYIKYTYIVGLGIFRILLLSPAFLAYSFIADRQ